MKSSLLSAALLLAAPALAFASGSVNTGGSGSYGNNFPLGSNATGITAPQQQIGVVGNSLGQINGRLTTETGRTLYTFASDPRGQSVCTGNCALQWPPYLLGPIPANIPGFVPIARPDGTRQWSLNGQPLYLFIGDQQVGSLAGEQVPGWRSVVLGGS